ncbi:MAG: 4Fe-4S binding protein [Xanthobacteraceae bacterium]|nr:MAG: 4Fe-4S binding protein [Xanthobacteraceae bacterium]
MTGRPSRPHVSTGLADAALARAGDWLMRHQRAIQTGQWSVVVVYVVLLIVPPFVPLPPRTAHIWNDVTLFSQFVFWGIWWPFVLLSMMLVGRLWCGVLCPEGFVSEKASAYSKGWSTPRWIKWKGWPFVAFACTTVYGQMISVYQYPGPASVLLGFSTVAAIAVAYFYGRNKRIWCRYLCPVSGVFAIMSKLAPVHFQVDRQAWDTWQRSPHVAAAERINCAPLVPIRNMRGASACHMCGRCSGFHGAVTLQRRSPNHEIVHVAGTEVRPVETLLILFGLMGVAAGAFQWGSSPLYVQVKQALATWLIDHGMLWPVTVAPPWWILTNYPEQNDVMTLLDGAVLIGYIVVFAALAGIALGLCVAAASRVLGPWSWPRFHHLVQSLIPLAGCGVFLGLSMTTVTLLRHDGFYLDFAGPLRAALLTGAGLWSLWLGWSIGALHSSNVSRRIVAMLPLVLAATTSAGLFASLFWRL